MEKITIKKILEEIKEIVEQQKTVSPNQWLDYALQLTGLWADLKSELLKAEIEYSCELAKLMEEDMTKAKAEVLAKTKPSYELWKYLLGRDKLVEEFVKLCKVRAKLEQDY